MGSRVSCKSNTRGMKNWRFWSIPRFISKTAIVTMEDGYELVCNLSTGAISNDFSDPNSDFKGTFNISDIASTVLYVIITKEERLRGAVR